STSRLRAWVSAALSTRADRRWSARTRNTTTATAASVRRAPATKPASTPRRRIQLPNLPIAIRRTGQPPSSVSARRPGRSLARVRGARRSVGLGETEHSLGQIVEGHLLRDRSYLVESHLPPEALDVELLRVTESAERLERGVRRLEAGLR